MESEVRKLIIDSLCFWDRTRLIYIPRSGSPFFRNSFDKRQINDLRAQANNFWAVELFVGHREPPRYISGCAVGEECKDLCHILALRIGSIGWYGVEKTGDVPRSTGSKGEDAIQVPAARGVGAIPVRNKLLAVQAYITFTAGLVSGVDLEVEYL